MYKNNKENKCCLKKLFSKKGEDFFMDTDDFNTMKIPISRQVASHDALI